MNWLDVMILALVVVSAIRGWRSGAAVQGLAFGGLWLGLLLGALVAPRLAGLVTGSARTWVALIVVFAAAALLGAAGGLLGARFAGVLRRAHLGPLDEALGVLVAIAATLLAVWLIGSLLSSSRYATLDQALQESRIVRALDDILPTVPSVFARIESFLTAEGFPVVFVNLPPGLVTPVAPPSDAAVQAAVDAAEPSTVKVAGLACGVFLQGSGFVVAPHLVVTNAHVVAGDTRPEVIDASGRHIATAMWFDPGLDVAVLKVPDLTDRPLSVHEAVVARGATGATLGYPGGGAFSFSPAAVDATFQAVGLDIYGTAIVTREVYELNAVVLPGDSGGPLVASGLDQGPSPIPNGTVIGLVFARSSTNTHIGYALTMGAVQADVARAQASGVPVSTGGCAP